MTRMRCWRITSVPEDGGDSPVDATGGAASSSSSSVPSDSESRQMELAIEYLLSKDNLKWITVHTEQAILISMCLQVGCVCVRLCLRLAVSD